MYYRCFCTVQSMILFGGEKDWRNHGGNRWWCDMRRIFPQQQQYTAVGCGLHVSVQQNMIGGWVVTAVPFSGHPSHAKMTPARKTKIPRERHPPAIYSKDLPKPNTPSSSPVLSVLCTLYKRSNMHGKDCSPGATQHHTCVGSTTQHARSRSATTYMTS